MPLRYFFFATYMADCFAIDAADTPLRRRMLLPLLPLSSSLYFAEMLTFSPLRHYFFSPDCCHYAIRYYADGAIR